MHGLHNLQICEALFFRILIFSFKPLKKFLRFEIPLFQFPEKGSIVFLSMALYKTAQKIKLSRFSLSGPLMTALNCGPFENGLKRP